MINNNQTTIYLTNEEEKIKLSVNNYSNNNLIRSKAIEVNDLLDNKIIKNFFIFGISSIKYAKAFITDTERKECIELKNIYGRSLIIITNDFNKYFSQLKEYIETNLFELLTKSLTKIIYNEKIDEIVLKTSDKEGNSEITVNIIDGKKVLKFSIPFIYSDKEKKIINQKQLDIIQQLINTYFYVNNALPTLVTEKGMYEYTEECTIYGNNNTKVIISSNELYNRLNLYLNLIKRDIEAEYAKNREKDFLKKSKSFLKILKKEE